MDRGAWWAAVDVVAKSQTRPKGRAQHMLLFQETASSYHFLCGSVMANVPVSITDHLKVDISMILHI